MFFASQWLKMAANADLHITPREWELAKAAMEKEIAHKKTHGDTKPFSFKIERIHAGGNANGVIGLNHSFIVADGKLIALARGKSYLNLDGNIEGILGHGSYGVCKLGQTETGEKFAIKIEPAARNATKKKLHTLENNIMQELGIIRGEFIRDRPFYSAWVYNKIIKHKRYIIQTLQPGASLRSMLPDPYGKINGYTHNAEIHLALNTAIAIQQIHAHNIVHSDLNSANLIVDKLHGEVAVIDYGFAIKLAAGKTFGQAHGFTKYYASPEIIKIGKCSKASDIYALGKIYQQHFNLLYIIDDSILAGKNLKTLLASMLAKENNRPTIENIVTGFKNYIIVKEQQENMNFMSYWKHTDTGNIMFSISAQERMKFFEQSLAANLAQHYTYKDEFLMQTHAQFNAWIDHVRHNLLLKQKIENDDVEIVRIKDFIKYLSSNMQQTTDPEEKLDFLTTAVNKHQENASYNAPDTQRYFNEIINDAKKLLLEEIQLTKKHARLKENTYAHYTQDRIRHFTGDSHSTSKSTPPPRSRRTKC